MFRKVDAGEDLATRAFLNPGARPSDATSHLAHGHMTMTGSGFLARVRERMGLTKPVTVTKPTAPSATNPPGSVTLGLSLLANSGQKNAVVAPSGVYTALKLAALGATTGSAAAAELQTVLGRGDGGFGAAQRSKSLTVATAVYAGADVKEQYKKRAETELGAEVAALPAIVDPVNAWVKTATKNKVPSILDAIPEGTSALLLSAVHFAAPWATAFDPENTESIPFAAATGNAPVKMMSTRNKRYAYGERKCGKSTVQVVSLPYGGGGGFAGIIVLPAPDSKLDDVMAVLGGSRGAAEWSKLIGSMRNTELCYLGLPRFKLEWGGSLVDSITAMGVKAPFAPGAFNEIAADTAITEIQHKATIECTEKGTVAAAATAIVMGRSLQLDKPEVVCNRPFIFAVTAAEELIFVCRVDDVVDPQ